MSIHASLRFRPPLHLSRSLRPLPIAKRSFSLTPKLYNPRTTSITANLINPPCGISREIKGELVHDPSESLNFPQDVASTLLGQEVDFTRPRKTPLVLSTDGEIRVTGAGEDSTYLQLNPDTLSQLQERKRDEGTQIIMYTFTGNALFALKDSSVDYFLDTTYERCVDWREILLRMRDR